MKIYDVTVPISEKVPVYEGDPGVKIDVCMAFAKGDVANLTGLSFSAHTATHVDAPSHFIDGARKVDDLELGKLIGMCRVVEVGVDVMEIGPEHLAASAGAERVLFKTRNSEFWSDPEHEFRKDFTYISPAAARVLADSGMKLVGIDYLSVEKFGSGDFATHIALLEREVVIIEGLDLRGVPPGDYELFCLPLKIKSEGGDGAPARVVLRGR